MCADLKKIYGAVNLDDAEYAKEEFREKWDKKYPNILKSWDKNWSELTTFFEYPQEIRKIIYTTNVYRLVKFLWSIDLRPIAGKLTKDYLVIGGSRDTMACRAGIGRQLLLLKNARSVSSREITTHEKGADHCCCGNQITAMDTVISWAELMKKRDASLKGVD